MIKFPFISRKKYENTVYKLNSVLCYATGGKYSKGTEYCVNSMYDMIDEYIDNCIENDRNVRQC